MSGIRSTCCSNATAAAPNVADLAFAGRTEWGPRRRPRSGRVVHATLPGPRPAGSARDAIRRLAYSRPAAVVEIDTRLDVDNASGLRTPAEIETVIARMDVVVTTRLHGLALALRNGVPVVAVDPVAGGDKITAQARAVDWPCGFAVDEASDDVLERH